MQPNHASSVPFASVRVPTDGTLRRMDVFEYTTATQMYKIELYENQDSTWYAIGVPRDGKMVVYGSNIVSTAEQALQTVVDKIEREGQPYEPSPPDADVD